MDEENLREHQTLNNLEELIVDMIIGALHHEMMVMSGSQYITSSHEKKLVVNEDIFSKYS
jgi:hypothetical protein